MSGSFGPAGTAVGRRNGSEPLVDALLSALTAPNDQGQPQQCGGRGSGLRKSGEIEIRKSGEIRGHQNPGTPYLFRPVLRLRAYGRSSLAESGELEADR